MKDINKIKSQPKKESVKLHRRDVELKKHPEELVKERTTKLNAVNEQLQKEITNHKKTEKWIEGLNSLKESLLAPGSLDEKLKRITDGIVNIFQADFARIWITKPGDRCNAGCIHAKVKKGQHVCRYRDMCLHLIASSGRYTHIDGEVHKRVPFGCYKIGRVAAGGDPKFLTNDVTHDQRIHHHKWAKELGLVSFAGYKLASPAGDPIGVLALFSKQAMSSEEDALLGTIASTAAQVFQTARTEEELQKLASVVRYSSELVNLTTLDGKMTFLNEAGSRMLGIDPQEVEQHVIPEVIPESHMDLVEKELLPSLMQGGTWEGELQYKNIKTGKLTDVHAMCFTVKDPQTGIPKFLANVSLDIAERKQAEKLQSSIYRISETAHSAENLEELYRSIHNIIGEMMPAKDNFYIALYDKDSDMLSFPYFVDQYEKNPGPQKLGKGLTEYVIRTGNPLLATPEVFDELEKEGHVVSIGPPSIDWLGVPLRTKDRTIGVLGVQGYKEGVRYTEEDKNMLTFVSEQVATTIERKQIEEALRESEARFRVLSEAAFEGIVVSDKRHILDANDQCAHIFGYKKSELIRKSVVDLVAPESRELVKKNIESGYEEPYEYQALRKDGTVISVEVTGKSIPYKGRLVRVTAIRDITDRKQAEEALRESKNLFSTFMDHLPAGAFIKDENSITQYVNKYMDDTFGAKEWIGKNTLELFPEKVAKRMNEEDRKALRKGMTVIEEQIPDKNGNIHTYQTFKFPILRKDKPGLLGGIGFDITKHKKAEQREKHLQEYLQLQIDRMPIALIVWDSDFRVQTWNPAAEKIFGFTVEETRGKHPYGLIVPKQAQPHVDNIWRRLLEGDATAHSTNENITKEGATIICDWSNTPLKRADGSVIGVLSMVQDITERKQAEEQIKASLREKEVLLQEIHHRVKNNMQIISSLIKLQSRHLKNGHMLELFKSTQNRVQSMAAIHERLYQSKDFTRINFNEYVQKLTVHLFSIYGISKEAVRLNTNIKDVSLDINTAIPCGLIINELVSNSLKHAFLNGKKGEIKIAMQLLNGNEIELIVSDNGIGLPKEVNFRKTESLGLHLVTILAEDQLHGDIELDRTAGTRFRMRFRLSEK